MASKYKKSDPFLSREAGAYKNPVPSREFLLSYFEEMEVPRSFRQVVTDFALNESQHVGLKRRLGAMERDRQLIKNRRGSFALVNQMEVLRGTIQVHRDGFGFLIPDDGSSDLFLPARQVRGLFTDDVVLASIVRINQRGRREGVILEVIEQNTHQVVGRLRIDDHIGFVIPDSNQVNQDIIVAEHDFSGAKNGQFVVVELQSLSNRKHQLKGKVVEILGDHLTAGLEVELAIRAHEIPFTWTSAVEDQVKVTSKDITKKDYSNRRDLRHLAFVTIDGEDAQDFDDAVYCEKAGDGWRVFVAIADVSHYVKPKSAIDIEATNRGNSVYFPSRVIPMLHEVLSNDLCSLRPKVERLVLVCEVNLDASGGIIDYKFYESVIQSHARLTYSEVMDEINGKSNIPSEIKPKIQDLHLVYQALLSKRNERGSIDFDTMESRVVFDDFGKVACIISLVRNDAHRLIEELMLLANRCSAEFVLANELPILFRNHEAPDSEKTQGLRDFLKMFGLRLSNSDQPTAMDYNKFLQRIEDRPESHLLKTVLLRSLKQAKFETKNKGHFGLAFESYCQFTSPIRRYPDLLVHRCIKKSLGISRYKKYPYTIEQMTKLGEHFSMTERRADRATRDSLDWLKCDYMKDKLGQGFGGIITSVVGFGLFVELDDIFVEGLIHINNLDDDYYHFDNTHHTLTGRKKNRVYRLGDKINIIVARVDLDQRKIDFDISNG